MSEATATEQKQTFRREIDLGDGSGKQVFEAESPEALIDKLADAQVHATKKIREQAQQLEAAQTQVEESESGGAFDKQKWFGTLYEEPLGAIDQWAETRFGMPVDQLVQRLGQMEQATANVTQSSVMNEFVARHPELLQVSKDDDVHNSQVVGSILQDNNLPLTANTLEMAYALAKDQGKLKLPAAQQEDQPIVPVTLTSKRGTQTSAVSQEEERRAMARMSRPELEEYLRKKHGDRVFGG